MEPEAYEVFRRMAESAGVSVSRCMGDWLADTADAAQLATNKLVEIRRSPERVAHDYLALQAEEAVALMEGKRLPFDMDKFVRLNRQGIAGAVSGARAGKPAAAPGAPSSNTGLKSPRTRKG
jgi:hypothetical protein